MGVVVTITHHDAAAAFKLLDWIISQVEDKDSDVRPEGWPDETVQAAKKVLDALVADRIDVTYPA